MNLATMNIRHFYKEICQLLQDYRGLRTERYPKAIDSRRLEETTENSGGIYDRENTTTNLPRQTI